MLLISVPCITNTADQKKKASLKDLVSEQKATNVYLEMIHTQLQQSHFILDDLRTIQSTQANETKELVTLTKELVALQKAQATKESEH
jgi:hypothetical protein